MADPYLGEIRMMSFGFAPRGWALCNGQLMSISQNTGLFAMIGTAYGGDGVNTFQLPDLRGRMPLHAGGGFALAQKAGAEVHTLSIAEIPTHTHGVRAVGMPGVSIDPSNKFFASNRGGYSDTADTALDSSVLFPSGGSQPHENRPPYAVLSFCIAIQGLFFSPPPT